MKNILLISVIVLSLFACKKTKFEPEGPTDVRVRNSTADVIFSDVKVKNSSDSASFGNIGPKAESEYIRFTKAYPKAEITAKINGVLFSTAAVNYTYMQYIGLDKITYEVYISNMSAKELSINFVYDEPLVLK
jgi:hypothetical protein